MKYVISALLALVYLSACSAPLAKTDPFAVIHTETSQRETYQVVQITNQLEAPWGLAFLPDGDFLISQKTGAVVRVSAQTGAVQTLSGAPDALVLGQGGLLDIKLAPDFADTQLVYMVFAEGTKQQNHTAIARARLQGDDLLDLQVIFRANTEQKTGGQHFGSRLLFDDQGYLFASIGDGGRWLNEAQNPQNHFGVMIRLHGDGSIPTDNPFADGRQGAPEVWSYGHRNPQGLALHPKIRKPWQSEHGPRGGDEINVLVKGANFGWPKATFGIGYSGRTISKFTALDGMVSPLLHWTPSIAPSGLDFYAGEKFVNWQGDLFSGTLKAKHLRRIKLDGQTVVEQEELLGALNQRIRHVQSGPDGYLYLLTDAGQLLRLEPTAQENN